MYDFIPFTMYLITIERSHTLLSAHFSDRRRESVCVCEFIDKGVDDVLTNGAFVNVRMRLCTPIIIYRTVKSF